MRIIHKAATSQSLYFSVNDSASTSGGKKTAIAFNTTSLVASYTRNGAARTAITLATQTASGAWSSGGFVEVDATNEPGLYRLDVPDAAFATGVDSVVVQIGGATGMVWAVEEVQLVGVDPQDATAFGLSRIDAAISSRMATFTLPTNFSSLAIDASGRITVGSIVAGAIAAATFAANALGAVWDELRSAHVTASTFGQGVIVATNNDKTGYALTAGEHTSIGGDVWDAARASHVTAASFGQGVASVQGNVTGSVASLTTNNDKTGYALSAAGVQAIWDALTSALTTVGSIGKLLVTNLDAAISSRLATSGYTAPLTTTQVENAVWDATAASHVTVGSTGAKLTAAANAGDPMATAVPGAYAAGTAGFIIGNLPGSVWDVAIASHTSAGSVGNKLNSLSGASGSGALTVTITVQNDVSHPVAGAQFWVTTDVGGTNIVASGTTDTFGKVTVFLNAGTYYGFASKPGENFTNPATLVVA